MMQSAPAKRLRPGLFAVATTLVGLSLGMGQTTADEDLERRVERMERLLDSGALSDLANRQERLRREVSELVGQMETLQREMDDIRRQQRNLFEDLDDRLMELEQAGVAAQEPGVPDTPALDAELEGEPQDAPPPEDDDAMEAAADDDGDAADAYSAAFDLLRDGDYRRAADGFRDVLDNHADSDYADNARYWLAETYYVVREFDEAMEHFQQIVDDPDSGKHADALLKAGYIHYEREEWDRARDMLEQVRDDYPDSTVASLAGNRLDQMDDEGR